jgi:tRNA threonylcarbamoyladenosine biosynthesis protein TsaE
MNRFAATAPITGERVTHDAAATRQVGRTLGRAAVPGTVLALIGPLGAGKTQLAKGVADGLGVTTVVNSPTFILMNEHGGRLRLYHIDAYRLADPEEAVAAGLLDERQVDGVTVIEWADRLEGWLPADRLEIELLPGRVETDRLLRLTAHGPEHERLAREVLGTGS